MNMISWLNRRLAGKQHESNESVRAKLASRCTAEIVARITRRAEIHEEHGGYHARCSPLDREAAERIIRLEARLAVAEGRSPGEFEDQVRKMLGILREP